MPKINILDKNLAGLIAAGEVVERPASVVKEILENAIDAGAKRITIEIKNGGIKLIRIIDDGCGIARGDVKNAFLRHATSKILTQDDLFKIGTLGFRGEALASICAVSRVEILTKTPEETIGTLFKIEGGEENIISDAGSANGTNLTIRDLFFNTPARMKFLKKDVSEANAIASIIDKIALSKPDVSFKFIRDGKEAIMTPGDGDVKSAIYSVCGKEFFEGLIPVDYDLEGIKITGFISKPSSAKSTRAMQNFFLNNRYIRNKTAMAALEEAFKNSIMVGKFPSCVLYISAPFSSIDVNVHPAKTEVKFANEKIIFDAVYYAAKSALMQNTIQNPLISAQNTQSFTLLRDSGTPNFAQKKESETKFAIPIFTEPFLDKKFNIEPKSIELKETEKEIKLPKFEEKIAALPEPEILKFEPQEVQKLDLVGEIFSCYIILQKGENEIILVDKHAAHERLIFEKLKSQTELNEAQILLQPIQVLLEKIEHSAILENLEMISKIGFDVADFGSKSVLVRAIPNCLEIREINDAISEIANYILKNKNEILPKKIDWIYHNIACRTAVKSGDKTSEIEIKNLIKNLIDNPEIMHCPHGRPIFVTIKKSFFEKQFGRA